MNKKIISIVAVAFIIGVGAGYAGANAFRSASPAQNARGSFSTANGGNFSSMRGGTANGGMLSGTVAAKDAESITVDTKDGSSHIILVTPATSFSKSVNGSQSDVAVDATVIISGTANSDGSMTAQSVQIRPAGSMSSTTPAGR